MVARNTVRQYFYDDTPSEPETPRITRIGSHGAPADDGGLLYVIVDRLRLGLIVLAGIMAVGYIVGFSFACGFRCAFSL